MEGHYAKSFKKPENQTVKEHINDTRPQRADGQEGLYFGKGDSLIWGIIASLP